MISTKIPKIIAVLLLIVMGVMIFGNVYAAGEAADKNGKLVLDPDKISGASTEAVGDIQSIGQQIAGVLQAVGVVVSVIMLLVLGIKYMTGSAEEKAVDKKSFMPYVIGAALIFAATQIAGAVIKFFTT